MAMLAQQCTTASASKTARSHKASRLPVVKVQASVEAALPRRAALGFLATGAAALIAHATPAEAAYGEPANVFGRVSSTSGFVPYEGEGFSVKLPSKWNPSKERTFDGTVLRYEDNFDPVNTLEVITKEAGKPSIDALGAPEQVLNSELRYLLGKQAFAGETISEGGFAPGRVAAASLLDSKVTKDKQGKTYYNYHVLTRTADGTEGGRHRLITTTVSNGKLWVLNVQVGDKRWFKGIDKLAEGAVSSFNVA